MSKPRNPGYRARDHWLICDVCGHAYRHSKMRKRWDGAVVCQYDWEPRHPQDFLRARRDDQTPKGLIRSEPPDQFQGQVLGGFTLDTVFISDPIFTNTSFSLSDSFSLNDENILIVPFIPQDEEVVIFEAVEISVISDAPDLLAINDTEINNEEV